MESSRLGNEEWDVRFELVDLVDFLDHGANETEKMVPQTMIE